jgi:hypothetical protein
MNERAPKSAKAFCEQVFTESIEAYRETSERFTAKFNRGMREGLSPERVANSSRESCAAIHRG